MIDRERFKSCGFPTTPLQSCVMSGPLRRREASRDQCSGLLSVISPCGFKVLLKISESILPDNLDNPRYRLEKLAGMLGHIGIGRNPPRAPRDRQKAWAPSILKPARGGLQVWAQQNPSPAQQNPSPVQQNPNPSQRNPNRSSFRESWLLNGLSPISARLCGYDICVSGPLRSESSVRAGQ